LAFSDNGRNTWIAEWMTAHGVALWGVADLGGMATTPKDKNGVAFGLAVSWAGPMSPAVMAGIRSGPTQAYADEYARVNRRINALSRDLADAIRCRGYRAKRLAASERTDTVNIRGDFPHKTAATRAGLGWIGRHCQLITRPFGSWVRLGTVFTDMPLTPGRPTTRNFCGRCKRCITACPAQALSGVAWYPGIAREEILDVQACDRWKKAHYFQFHGGHNCGICSSVCPYGLKYLKRSTAQR
jgi:epoxyqueuosine reductase QueG